MISLLPGNQRSPATSAARQPAQPGNQRSPATSAERGDTQTFASRVMAALVLRTYFFTVELAKEQGIRVTAPGAASRRRSTVRAARTASRCRGRASTAGSTDAPTFRSAGRR